MAVLLTEIDSCGRTLHEEYWPEEFYAKAMQLGWGPGTPVYFGENTNWYSIVSIEDRAIDVGDENVHRIFLTRPLRN